MAKYHADRYGLQAGPMEVQCGAPADVRLVAGPVDGKRVTGRFR